MDDSVSRFELPGFRFHPTEEELLDFYLRNMIFEKKLHFNVIGFLNIYRYDPWDLPGLAKIGEREWYFFVPRDRKNSNGGRPNRTTEHGYWKATGSDRKVVSLSDPKRVLGLRKTLVFYKGRAPRGTKTDWVMNEYRLSYNCALPKDIVLCKVYRKATSLKVLEQWAANEEEATTKSTPLFKRSYPSNTSQKMCPIQPIISCHVEPACLKEEDIEMDMDPHEFAELILQGDNKRNTEICQVVGRRKTLTLPLGQEAPPQLQVPDCTEWAQAQNQEALWAQLCSPWLENILSQFTPTSCAADILNF